MTTRHGHFKDEYSNHQGNSNQVPKDPELCYGFRLKDEDLYDLQKLYDNEDTYENRASELLNFEYCSQDQSYHK